MQDDFLDNEDNNRNCTPEREDEFSLEAILKDCSDENKSEQQPETNKPLQEEDDSLYDTKITYINKNQQNAPEKKREKNRSEKERRGNRRGCLMSFITILIIALVSVFLASCVLVASCELLGVGKERITGSDRVQIYVEEGTSIKSIAKMLKDRDIIISKYFFLAYLKYKHKGTDFNYGYHDLLQNMGYEQIIEELEEPAKAEDIEVKVPEGSSIDEIASIMEKNKVCTADAFKNAAINGTYESELLDAVPDDSRIHYRLEGYLFPDTYRFFENDDPERVIQKMLDNTESKFTTEMRQQAAELGYTTHQILAMASVIELESCGYFDEMPSVSAVFWNRLNNWEEGARLLQSDVTMNYPYGDGYYNTYTHEGLPIGPLCNVTEAALKAAVYPREDFDYYYFVTDSNFKFYYNKTNAEHESTIASLKRRGLWLS